MLRNIFVILFLSLNFLGYSQAPGCPGIDLGPDTTISCNTPCVTLNASILDVGLTNTYTVSSLSYAPPYPFNQGNAIFVNLDDVWSELISLPFNFCFFGNTYNQIVIGANGVISFDISNANGYCAWSFTNTIPNSTGVPYRNSINGAYHDIDPSVGGNIKYSILGSYPCRTFVVNYYNVPHYLCNNITTTQQIVLYETTNVIEVYVQDKPTCSAWNGGRAVIGIQNASGTIGFTPPNRNTSPWSTSNEAWRFTPNGSSICSVDWFDNGTLLGSGLTMNVCPSSSSVDYDAVVTYSRCDGTSITETDTINVSINNLPANTFNQTSSICYGDSIFLQNAWQTQSGVYVDTFTTATCDSIVETTLSLNILPVITPNFTINGNTIVQPGPIYQLTQALNTQAGSVWNSSLLDLNFPFDFEVELFFGCNNGGADGMAFVLQQVSSTIGSSGGGIGYLGISPSFSVEFDTWQNASGGQNYADPVYDHLAIQKNGDLNHNGINNLFGPIGFPPGNINIEDCNWHDVRFIWNPSINLFIVNFDGVQLVNNTIDIINTCFSGNPNVYWGFTAATGGANNLQQFKFKNYNLLDNTICRGDSIQINALINNSSLSYMWLPSSSINNNTIPDPFFFPNITTNYVLKVTNSYGCSIQDTFNIYVDTVDITGITNTSVLCNGGNNGQAMVLLGGNSSFYNYQWNDINNQTTQIAYNLTTGNYNCIVTNDNYCTDTANVTIFEPPPISSVDIQIHCNSYTWIDGNTYTASNNTATYTILTPSGCDSVVTLNLIINSSPTVVASATPATICVNDSTTLTGSGASTYSWDNGATDGVPISPITTTTYIVTGTDASGCVNTDMITVTVNALPIVTASSNPVSPLCDGDLLTLTGSGATSYIWGNGVLDNIAFTASVGTVTHTVTGTDVNGCVGSSQITINVNPLPTAIISGATTICAGNNTALSFALNGLPPFTLNYTDGINNFNIVLDSNGNTSTGPVLVSPTANTIYTLLDITDNNTCFNTLSDTTLISVQNPSAGINTTSTFCSDIASFDMWALLGGNPAVGGIWMDNVGNIVSNIFDPTISNPGTFTYSVTAAPCPTTYADLIININIIPTINISGTDTICIGEFSDLSFTLTGLAPFNVDYTDGTNSFNVNLDANGNNASSGFPISHYPLINTDYTIIGITDANGCSNTGSGIADKIVNPLPNVTINGSVGICLGDSTDLAFTVWDGTAPFTVTLNDGTVDSYWLMDNNGTVNGLPITISPNTSTTYSLVEVTDANGCWNELNGNATIIVHALPTALISGTTTLCEDEFTPIAFTLQNGLPPYNVNYNINGVATSNSFSNSGLNTIMVSPSTTTVYSLVNITDANNCFNTASDSVTINVNEKVNAIISGGGDICNDGSQVTIDIITDDSTIVNVTYTNGFNPITLSGIGPFEIITNQAGVYMITDVVDIYGCAGTYSGNATITVHPLPLAGFSFFPQPTDLDNPHINFINHSFGHNSAIWDFGDGSALNDTISKLTHTYQDTGHYRVNLAVSNQFGCTDTIEYTIIIDPVFIIYIPDAFTPNGDNINDTFGLSVYGIKEFEMKIYDRWGQIIYHTTEKNKPWDGTINNNETQAGIYTYSIVVTDLKDKPHKFVGAFTLIK